MEKAQRFLLLVPAIKSIGGRIVYVLKNLLIKRSDRTEEENIITD